MFQDLVQADTSLIPHIGEITAIVVAVLGSLRGYEYFKEKKNGNPGGHLKDISVGIGEMRVILERVEEGNAKVLDTMTEMRVEMAKLRTRPSQ